MLLLNTLKIFVKRLLINHVLLIFWTVAELEAEFVKSCGRKFGILILVLLIEKFVKIVPDLVNLPIFANFLSASTHSAIAT